MKSYNENKKGKNKMWAAIERAYGEYEITCLNTKKECMNFLTAGLFKDEYKSRRLNSGEYEIKTLNTTHLIMKTELLKENGYQI